MFEQFFNKRRTAKGVEIEDSIMTVTEKEKAIIETPLERKGIAIIWYVALSVIIFLMGRVFYLDFFQKDYYSEVAKGNRVRSIIIKAPRGNIYDKYGKILARNMPSIDVVVIPSYLPKDFAQRRSIAGEVAKILEIDAGNVEVLLESQEENSLDPVLLEENISSDQALILAEKINELPGIIIEKTAIRSYENGLIFSPIIGYDGKITREEMEDNKGNDYLMTDYIGKTGIEKNYEAALRGKYGANQVEIDSLGKIKKSIGIINPEPGSDLVLNIDEELQKKLYDSMVEALEKTETKTATAVAMDPRTGGVLALVSIPSYDNNLFARGISNDEYKMLISDSNLPLLNRAINGEYPPGSTFKPAIAAAALIERIVTPETTVDCNGAIHVGSWRFGDWKTHGVTNIRDAIAESCDVYFYSLGGGYGNISGLGMNTMKKYADLFGFGQLTRIDLPDESNGFIPDEQWKLNKKKEKWYIGDSYHSSIGQGFITSTPIQLAAYTSALANGGTLYVPRIVNRIRSNNGQEQIINPEVVRNNFIPEDVMKVVREGMRQTVTDGTAQQLKDLPVAAAGKTGTAEFGGEDKTHAWFISFAPYENPEIAIVVLVEGGGEGHSSSVPITRDVLEWYFTR